MSCSAEPDRTLIVHHRQRCEFDVFIDALKSAENRICPSLHCASSCWPAATTFRTSVMTTRCRRRNPVRGRVAFGALPWLMHDRPFVQGLTASAEIGSAMARAVSQQAAGRRRRLWYIE